MPIRALAGLALAALAVGLPLSAQVSVLRTQDGRIIYRRATTDQAFKPNGGIGWPPKGADQSLWWAYDPYIIAFCIEEGVDPVLAKSVIWAESRFKWRATSPKKAKGLMQLLGKTAERFGHTGDPYDPIANIHAGVRYLAFLQTRFSGNLIKISAAYNAGEGAVEKYGGVPPFRETKNYVPSVLFMWDWIQKA